MSGKGPGATQMHGASSMSLAPSWEACVLGPGLRFAVPILLRVSLDWCHIFWLQTKLQASSCFPFHPSAGMARFQDQLYSQRICYLRHHCALQEGKHFSTLITCCFQNRVILCKLQLNIYNSFKSSKRDMVLKHNCDVGFMGFFFISKYLQSCSVDTRVETT